MVDQRANQKTVTKSLLAVVAMFAFGFAMVPLYDVFCDITGLNGKTKGQYDSARAEAMAVDETRLVRVQFVTSNNEQMPWEFRPETAEMKVHPGKLTEVNFFARNPTNAAMVAQAVPSLSPSQGIDYFHKTECFCFNQQALGPQEQVLMPLRFVVDKALPQELKVLTLSYTLFDQTEEVQLSVVGEHGTYDIAAR